MIAPRQTTKHARAGGALVWLRHDLRLSDNPALAAAVDGADWVLPVYIHAPEEDAPWAPGAASRWWLHRSLADLATRLRALGSRLVLRTGASRAVLIDLARRTGAGAVYWNDLYEPAARRRDDTVERVLVDAGLSVHRFHDRLLHRPAALTTRQGGPYQVFTPFWRALGAAAIPAPRPAPRRLKPPARWPRSLRLAELALDPDRRWTNKLASCWQPGEAAAWRQLRRFCRAGIDDYARGRDALAAHATSRLSPHLHFGELSPRQAWHAALAARAERPAQAPGADAFLRQLAWRDFAHHMLYHFPHTDRQALRDRFARFPWRRSAKLLEAWRRGRTGFPLVDAGMRELWATGTMHNRARMVVASFLVKNCMIHWREGARWFWDTLVDADLANNSLGWQWVAGSGPDAAPYFRVFNPVLQGRKFDPEGEYIARWVPELARLPAAWRHEPWNLPETLRVQLRFAPGRDYPRPVVDYAASRTAALAAYRALRASYQGRVEKNPLRH
jgi:deoxyribodipyrimidine photo-lyase